MGVLHGNRDRVEPPGPNLVKSRDPLADPIFGLRQMDWCRSGHYQSTYDAILALYINIRYLGVPFLNISMLCGD